MYICKYIQKLSGNTVSNDGVADEDDDDGETVISAPIPSTCRAESEVLCVGEGLF